MCLPVSEQSRCRARGENPRARDTVSRRIRSPPRQMRKRWLNLWPRAQNRTHCCTVPGQRAHPTVVAHHYPLARQHRRHLERMLFRSMGTITDSTILVMQNGLNRISRNSWPRGVTKMEGLLCLFIHSARQQKPIRASRMLGQCDPVEPKPPAPRAVSPPGSSSTTMTSAQGSREGAASCARRISC
jgi:hypothetical protein